jgi:hypothetical protein
VNSPVVNSLDKFTKVENPYTLLLYLQLQDGNFLSIHDFMYRVYTSFGSLVLYTLTKKKIDIILLITLFVFRLYTLY